MGKKIISFLMVLTLSVSSLCMDVHAAESVDIGSALESADIGSDDDAKENAENQGDSGDTVKEPGAEAAEEAGQESGKSESGKTEENSGQLPADEMQLNELPPEITAGADNRSEDGKISTDEEYRFFDSVGGYEISLFAEKGVVPAGAKAELDTTDEIGEKSISDAAKASLDEGRQVLKADAFNLRLTVDEERNISVKVQLSEDMAEAAQKAFEESEDAGLSVFIADDGELRSADSFFSEGEISFDIKISGSVTFVIALTDKVQEQAKYEYSKTLAGYTIELKAAPGVLPENVETDIRLITKTEDGLVIRDIVENEIDEDKEILDIVTFDITFTADGKVIEPEEGTVSVSIKLNRSMEKTVEDAQQEYEDVLLDVFHIEDDKAEVVESELTEDNNVLFDAEKFSPYTVVIYASQVNTATLNTIDGGTISTQPNGKPLVLIFFSTTCGNCRSILSTLAGTTLSKSFDFIAAEMNYATKQQVIDYGYRNPQITYCYDARTVAWSYYHQVGGGNTLSWPLIVYIYSNGDIQGYTTSYVDILSEIEQRLGASPVSSSYTVQYNANGGSGDDMLSSICYVGYSVNARKNTYTRKGYTFTGWNTKADGTGTSYDDEGALYNLATTDGAAVTLYAIWKKTKYKITYKLEGGTNSADNPSAYYVNTATITLAAPTRKGYAFGGWYSDSDLTKKVTQIKKGSTGNKTLYAKWTANKYSIQFVGNGSDSGSVAKMTGCEYGTTYSLSANAFKKTGYKFTGWNTKADGNGSAYSDKAQVKNLSAKDGATVKLYAQWQIVNYAIKYNLNSGTNNASNPADYNVESALITLAAPTRKGYTFGGWFSDSTFTTAAAEIPSGSTGTKTFYAKWTVNKYTVKFSGNGATSGEMTSVSGCKYDATYTLAANSFARKGYKFAGWNTKADGSGSGFVDQGQYRNLSAKNKATVTLYAQWAKNTYTIKFAGNGSTSGSMASQKNCGYDAGIVLSANAFVKTGYTFDSWNTKSDGSGKSYSDQATVTNLTATDGGTVTLYARWTKTPYTITYNLKGGVNSVDNPSTYYITTKTIVLQDAGRDGYTFGGWYSDSKYTTQVTQIPKGSTGNKTLYAKWTAHKYTVKFNGNGSTSGSVAALTGCKYGGTYTLPANAFKRTGFKFAGWNTKKDGTGKHYTDCMTVKNLTVVDGKTITLYAQWECNSYTVKFNGNGSTGGSMTALKDLKYDVAYALSKNAFSKKGYTFTGWNTKADGSGNAYKDQQSVKNLSGKDGGAVTLYAQWRLTDYTITYKLNNGTNNSDNPATYCIDTETISLKNPTRKGYTFKGWFAESDYQTKVTSIAKGSTGNKTFYAKWQAISYSIAFDGNGASSGTVESLTGVKYDKTVTLAGNSFARKGYTFNGWNTKADGSGSSYADKASVKNLSAKSGATVTLYAQWKAIKYKIAFNGNGSTSGSMATMTCDYGKSYSLTANAFQKTSYAFAGWNTKADGSGKTYADKASVKNLTASAGKTITLYAQWNDTFTKINLGAASRSQADIRNFVANHPAGDTMSYGTAPSFQEPYAAGTLSDAALNGALNVLNTYRYIAGISSNVPLDSDCNDLASKASYLNYLNNSLTHYPGRPTVLADSKYDSLYEDGRLGARSSNIAWTSWISSLENDIYMWMDDGDESNIEVVGHRRWILYPNLSKVGFGRTEGYSAVHCHSGYSGDTGVSVAWPARNTPTAYFDSTIPWSLSMGRYVDVNSLDLTVKRKSDGRTWHFDCCSSDGFFNVDNTGYGDKGCIIFRPDGFTAGAGDTYTVTARFTDSNTKLTYDVNFFDLNAIQ